MAMTMPEQLEFFEQCIQRSRRGMNAAQASGNYHLAALNCRQAFKCRLMKGLIQWRTGTDPSDSLTEVLGGFAEDWAAVSAIGSGEAKLAHVPAELLPFIAYLIGAPCLLEPSSEGLAGDRLLDFVLGNWLITGSWNDKLWEQGLKKLRQMDRTGLCVQTYELYETVARAAEANLPALSQRGETLFAKRGSDNFFSGADQTEGGGEDNKVTIDYRLAALLKRAGFNGTGVVHAWRW
jgi:hypothetical protein